jgi:hypothetical protein
MNSLNNPLAVGGVILLVLAAGDRTVQIIVGILMFIAGLGLAFYK